MHGKQRTTLHAINSCSGGIVIASALAKAASPNQSAMLLTVYGIPAWASILLIQCELFLGVLLITQIARKLGYILGVVAFLTFACFSAYRAIAGFESCGCFGTVKVHPWLTCAMDCLLVMFFIWRLREARATQKPAPHNVAFSVASYVLLGGLAIAISHNSGSQTLGGDVNVITAGNLVVLEPEKWSGKKLPIADSVFPKVDMSSGNWTVLLFHHDCPKCQEALPLYEQLAQQQRSEGNSRRVVLVEVPPYGHAAHNGVATMARLADNVEWFVQAPIEINVENGIVTGSSCDLSSIAAFRGRVDSLTTTNSHLDTSSLE
jgi:hypothetical protein